VHFYQVDPSDMNEPWRYIEVEVTPQMVSARWREEDGSLHLIGVPNQVRNTVDPISVELLQEYVKHRAHELDKMQFTDAPRRIEYNPRGALGLFVMHAVVDFRNVIYEPLPEDLAP